MTLFEWFLLLPLWIRIIICIVLVYLLIEALLMPYRANIRNKMYKDIQKTLEAILEVSKENRNEFVNSQQVSSLLLGMIAKNKIGDINDTTKHL